MPISDSDHLEFMQNTSRSLGEIKATADATLNFVKAVNDNQKKTEDKLQTHEKDPSAHGQGERRNVWATIGGVIGAIAAVAGIAAVVTAMATK